MGFCKEDIEAQLKELGAKIPDIYFYSETDSTNTRAKEHARLSQEKAAVFIADSQTAGRGRRGRSFFSQGGTGIYISFLVFPSERISDITYLTPHCAVALARALSSSAGVSADIKWVNDLYINDKKIAGILAECETDENGNLTYFVVGMGINVYKTDFPSELSGIAASVEDASGVRVSRERLAAFIIREFFEIIERGECDSVYDEYVSRSCILGRRITVAAGDESYPATARSINRDFSLTVERDSGEICRLFFGEVSTKINKDE